MPFGVVVWVGPNNRVLWAYIGSDPDAGRGNFGRNATYRESTLRQCGYSQIILRFLVYMSSGVNVLRAKNNKLK